MEQPATYKRNGYRQTPADKPPPDGKVPPQAIPLEEAAIGAILTDRDAIGIVLETLRPESFYIPANAEIFRACLKLNAAGEPIDILTVTNALTAAGKLDKVGGMAYIVELSNRVASSANLEYHARIVAQKALARDIIQAGYDAIREAHDEATDAFALLEQAQSRLFDLANVGGRKAMHVSQIAPRLTATISRAMQKPDGITGAPTGFKALDGITGGWQKTDLIVIAARPGMGKTALVLNNALYAAKQGIPVAIFSLEMGAQQLFNRIISMETEIPAGQIMKGQLREHEWQAVSQAIEEVSRMPIYIDDTSGLSIQALRSKARMLKAQHGIQVVIIDYLQLMSGGQEGQRSTGNREQEISAISRGCKSLAKDLDVPVIALSQLSRAVETRGGSKRPQLSDLRESGAIEQDADIVAFIYRPEYYGITEDESGNSTAGRAEFIIAKHRNGALDDIGLCFHDKTTRFMDVSVYESSMFPKPALSAQTSIPASARPTNEDEIPF